MRPGRAKGRRRRRRDETFIWFRPAAITMEKTMRTPLAPENGHNCRGAVAHGNRTPVRIQQINIYTRRKGPAHLPLLHRRDVGREDEGA